MIHFNFLIFKVKINISYSTIIYIYNCETD